MFGDGNLKVEQGWELDDGAWNVERGWDWGIHLLKDKTYWGGET